MKMPLALQIAFAVLIGIAAAVSVANLRTPYPSVSLPTAAPVTIALAPSATPRFITRNGPLIGHVVHIDGEDVVSGATVSKIVLWRAPASVARVGTVDHGAMVTLLAQTSDEAEIQVPYGPRGWVGLVFIEELRPAGARIPERYLPVVAPTPRPTVDIPHHGDALQRWHALIFVWAWYLLTPRRGCADTMNIPSAPAEPHGAGAMVALGW